MSLISEKTIDDFGTWAKENEDKSVFPKIYETEKSYYMNKNPEEAYLIEYSFENMAELKRALEVYSGLSAESQILEKLTVEVCKNRSSNAAEIKADKDSLLQKEETSVEKLVKMPAKADRDLRNEKVVEEFRAWAKENKDNTVFPKISIEEDSYYIDRKSEETYLTDYSFLNVAGLKEALKMYSELSVDVQMLKSMIVEICRNKFESNSQVMEVHENVVNEKKEEKVKESPKTLPEFVYIF